MNKSISDLSKQPSLLDILKTLNSGAEDDVAYVIAGAFNLYAESRRRLFNQVLLTPNDIKAVLSVVDLMLTDRSQENNFAPSRSRKLSSTEEKTLLEAVEEEARRPQ